MAGIGSGMESKFVAVDGINTHYLEAGPKDAPTVALLHSGEFGGAAEISWEFTIPALAKHFHVVAPDWLGFGRTDKVFDFADGRGRVYRHMQRFFEVLGIGEADFIGNSMGGSNLARIICEPSPILPVRSAVLCSGGGFTPLTEARKTLLAYDGTPAAMKALLRAMLHDPKWGDDDAYVAKRQEMALMPGAWECANAGRLKRPEPETAKAAGDGGFGIPDNNVYENIQVPVLIVAGADDPLREPGYSLKLQKRIPNCEHHVFENCGHCPNIEYAERFNALVVDFLIRVNGV
jgi:2-hydroxymuconate-semialdehyde hydrolase